MSVGGSLRICALWARVCDRWPSGLSVARRDEGRSILASRGGIGADSLSVSLICRDVAKLVPRFVTACIAGAWKPSFSFRSRFLAEWRAQPPETASRAGALASPSEGTACSAFPSSAVSPTGGGCVLPARSEDSRVDCRGGVRGPIARRVGKDREGAADESETENQPRWGKPSRWRCSVQSRDWAFTSRSRDRPEGSSPRAMASTMSGARSASRRMRPT